MSETFLRLNPTVSLRWEGSQLGVETSCVLRVPTNNRRYELTDAVVNLLCLASTAQPEDALITRLINDVGMSLEEARTVIESLVRDDILIDSRAEPYQIWFEHGWHNALRFHLATRDRSYVDMGQLTESVAKEKALRAYLSDTPPEFFKYYGPGNPLPSDPMNFASAGEVLLRRRTSRSFSKESVTVPEIATILQYGALPARRIREYVRANYTADPLLLISSAYTPFEVYLVTTRVDENQPGVYHYDMEKHALYCLRSGVVAAEIRAIAVGQPVDQCAAVILVTAISLRYMWRYRDSRALRNMYMECASLAHRFILTAEALGVKHFLTPAMRDSQVDSLLGIDGVTESTMYLVGIGK